MRKLCCALAAMLLGILGVAAGSGFALFAWRAPRLRDSQVFAPISRESALVVNNIILAAVTCTVLVGTLRSKPSSALVLP